jgi:pyruvate formate-lyase activating enzyme-like uncharacterized protein
MERDQLHIVTTMHNYSSYREEQIAANIREYGYSYDSLAFPSPEQAKTFTAERDGLLRWLSGRAEFGCKGTKVDCRALSPGCRACIEGRWSCLFINGRCNCDCFYCPSPQDQTGAPQTNGISFASADDYAEYLASLNFSGASLSGGEPLLTPERTLEYLNAIRRRCGDGIHIWLYTNGTLLTSETCRRLRDAGVDEIRFDIGATRYNLKKLRVAVGIIPVITVEIPAVPEDFALMQEKLAEMADGGVNHLNLHQLRLTPHNFKRLSNRGYTFIHGEKVTVLESELAALRLVRHALENRIPLPVNYCSFPYKRRFQRAASRRRGAALAAEGYEEATESGYLRTLAVSGSNAMIASLTDAFSSHNEASGLWEVEPGGEGLLFAPRLWPLVRGKVDIVSASYHESALTTALTRPAAQSRITLPSGRSIAVARQQVAGPVQLAPDGVEAILCGEEKGIPGEILDFERIPSGLADYF